VRTEGSDPPALQNDVQTMTKRSGERSGRRKNRRVTITVAAGVLLVWAVALSAALPAFAGLARRERQALERIANQPATGIEPYVVLGDDGGPWDAESFRGRVTIVTFWATWCPPCLDEMPVLQQAHHDWADRGVRVFGVTTLFNVGERPEEEELAEIRGALEARGADYPNLVTRDQRDWKPYLVDSLPVTVLIDRQGVPIDYAMGTKGLRRILKRVEELLEAPRR
jgi:thiol-disulfide isomerase/thioredoxin